jgi:hypothetical protein
MSKTCALPKSVFPLKFKVDSPVHALQLARKLIKPFRYWTVGSLAEGKDKDGDIHSVGVKSTKAEAFCALGALLRVNTRHQKRAKFFLQQAAAEYMGTDPIYAREADIFDVNDRGQDKETHREVLKMFARAIQLAKKAAGKK